MMISCVNLFGSLPSVPDSPFILVLSTAIFFLSLFSISTTRSDFLFENFPVML
ncbi:hypothetical protein BD408DRAFT_424011 [Parasitella parasitica]|nr:hypothetical protein BD408DRAFT_424011 [Parasitella parasitica]